MFDQLPEEPTAASETETVTEPASATAPVTMLMDPNSSVPIVFYDFDEDTAPKPVRGPWGDLVAMLARSEATPCLANGEPLCVGKKCPHKKSRRQAVDGHASWAPNTYVEGRTRHDDNVLMVTAASLDLDHFKAGEIDRVRAHLESLKTEHVIHSTHQHRPGKDERYRLILPLSRPVEQRHWRSVWQVIVDALELPRLDTVCKNESRVYYLPSHPADVTPYFHHHRGEPIDVDAALEHAEISPTPPSVVPTPIATAPAPVFIDIGELRARLSDARRSKAHGDDYKKEQAAILGRVLDGESLGPIGGRHDPRLRATGIIAHWLPANTPWEITLELMRPCLVATPLDTGETFAGAVEKTRKLYEGSMRHRLAQDADKAAGAVLAKALADSVKARVLGGAANDIGDKWDGHLMLGKDGAPKVCEHNAQLLIGYVPELRGTIRWNDVTKSIEVRGGPFHGVRQEVLHSAVAAWLQRHHSFMGGSKFVGRELFYVALQNAYDPIAEYLNELAWDGTPRLDTFLEIYLGVLPTNANIKYVRGVSRKWLISLVARALQPGCKVDTVLVLEGEQGGYKSSALEALVGSKYFLDTALTLGEKDTMQAIASSWLIELGELASLRRAETEKVKQFITSKVDKFRPPYGHDVVDSPRRCVLVGTTNSEEYLQDATGNRRYWPVRVGEINVEAIERDREHILGEAVAAFRAEEKWWFVGDEAQLAVVETEVRTEEDPWSPLVLAWVRAPSITMTMPGGRIKTESFPLTTASILKHAVKREEGQLTRSDVLRVGAILRRAGWKQTRPDRDGPRLWTSEEAAKTDLKVVA